MAIASICKVERGLNFSYMYIIKASKVSTTYNMLLTQTEGYTIINLDVSSRELDNAIHNLTIPKNWRIATFVCTCATVYARWCARTWSASMHPLLSIRTNEPRWIRSQVAMPFARPKRPHRVLTVHCLVSFSVLNLFTCLLGLDSPRFRTLNETTECNTTLLTSINLLLQLVSLETISSFRR